jgi:hypothetical protein
MGTLARLKTTVVFFAVAQLLAGLLRRAVGFSPWSATAKGKSVSWNCMRAGSLTRDYATKRFRLLDV